MSAGQLLTSNFAPEAFYANFEEFLEGHFAMVRQRQMAYVWSYMLIRLARTDLEKARRVFDWAVQRVCVSMLADKRFALQAQEISPQGLKWAAKASATFGINPRKSLGLVEGIFLLERLGVWSESYLKSKFPKRTILEFRQRPESNEEIYGKIGWLNQFYQSARAKAVEDAEQFVMRRDTAIALAITALAGGHEPSDAEIDDAMNVMFPSHQSLAKYATKHSSPPIGGSFVNGDFVVEWVLGRQQEEMTF